MTLHPKATHKRSTAKRGGTVSIMMTAKHHWWFDGDCSECYYAWGHVPKVEFAVWIEEEDEGPVLVENIEYLWAADIDGERFEFVDAGTTGATPITRYKP